MSPSGQTSAGWNGVVDAFESELQSASGGNRADLSGQFVHNSDRRRTTMQKARVFVSGAFVAGPRRSPTTAPLCARRPPDAKQIPKPGGLRNTSL
jgi:hypothetical protein